MDSIDIEELFKSKKIVKDKGLIDAMIRNHAVLRDERASDLDKKLAQENMKRIAAYSSQDPTAKPIDPRSVQAPVVGRTTKQPAIQMQQEQPAVAPAAQPAAEPTKIKKPRVKHEYHPDFQHFNVSPEQFAAMPTSHKAVMHEFHKEVLAGQHPELGAKIKAAAAPKIEKSLDRLTTLFKNLKDQLQ